ncbi:hypothetical protein FOZ62_021508, partial [Perkinsus olseni]
MAEAKPLSFKSVLSDFDHRTPPSRSPAGTSAALAIRDMPSQASQVVPNGERSGHTYSMMDLSVLKVREALDFITIRLLRDPLKAAKVSGVNDPFTVAAGHTGLEGNPTTAV